MYKYVNFTQIYQNTGNSPGPTWTQNGTSLENGTTQREQATINGTCCARTSVLFCV